MQVHGDGFRAECACIVALAYPPGTGPQARARLERLASRYHVELVPLAEIEQAASSHGSPLPDTLIPETVHTAAPSPAEPDVTSLDWHALVVDRAPDATVEEVGSAQSAHHGGSLIKEPHQTRGL
jgi:hypothetical protein